jgi:hypothetical protein
MKNLSKYNQKVAASKAGMDVKTARKYVKEGKLPSELKQPHKWRTKADVFEELWDEIESYLSNSPRLQAKVMLEYLVQKYPEKVQHKHLRTLQRRFRNWRAEHGKGREVIFEQIHYPGRQSQSDYTRMGKLGVTILGEAFPHLIFHYMLVYSRWESVMICYEESFNSMVFGFEKASWELGGVAQEHRTDNLSAAVKRDGTFTERWKKVMRHYRMDSSKNNPSKSNENGSVEKSNDLFKVAVEQQLILRGSKDFASIEEYKNFLEDLVKSRNSIRKELLAEEQKRLRKLPRDKWYFPEVRPVRVNPQSVVHIGKIPYSVPSRLISYTLRAHIYPDKIELYYGNKKLQTINKCSGDFRIDYRHIIGSLLRKPGAFHNYKYKEALFPRLIFRKAYDFLHSKLENRSADKNYLGLLQLAKMNGEQNVVEAIELYLEEGETPLAKRVKELLELPMAMPAVLVMQPDLAVYDHLREIAQ